MSNERLRSAIFDSGITYEQLSEQVGVDPKTVERWISQERVPHRTHRLTVASMLGRDEAFLWPSTKSDPRSIAASEAEFVCLYPNRGSVSPELWQSLINQSKVQIDLLAFAASFLHDAVPDFDDLLELKAREGVRIRLLFGDPKSAAVNLRGEEEGIGDLLAARCRLTWNYFAPVIGQPGVEARSHGSTLYNSIFRFDDTLLVNAHSFGAPASHSVVMHLQKVAGGRLFTHYMAGFDTIWDSANPLAPKVH